MEKGGGEEGADRWRFGSSSQLAWGRFGAVPPAPRATCRSCGRHCPLQSPEECTARLYTGHSFHPLLLASPHVGFSMKFQARREVIKKAFTCSGSTGIRTGGQEGPCPVHPHISGLPSKMEVLVECAEEWPKAPSRKHIVPH